MKENKSIRNTQQTSNYIDYSQKNKSKYNNEAWMFREDICADFSITFQKSTSDKEFYGIKASDNKLESLLEFQQYDFLRYEFDKLLIKNTNDLLQYGRAYVEKILWFDEKDNLVRISFNTFRYKKQIRIGDKLYYRLIRYDGSIEKGVIDNKNLIVFHLKDLGYSKHYFSHKMKRLKKIKMPDMNMVLNKDSGFDWSTYTRKQEYKILKIMKGVYWSGRNSSNQFISEPYLIYRKMKFELIRMKILDYLLGEYNGALQELGEIYDFSGQIIYKSKMENYTGLIADLREGNKNCEEIANEIF